MSSIKGWGREWVGGGHDGRRRRGGGGLGPGKAGSGVRNKRVGEEEKWLSWGSRGGGILGQELRERV